MRPDILELERFYRSQLGESARRLINVEIKRIWPKAHGCRILGIGYAVPFLSMFLDAERKSALMPATQGVWPWPKGEASLTCLGREDELPFSDGSFDRIILAHAVECSPHINRLFRESWRVLADGGRLIAIVPNRQGLWCWSDRSPFGTGQPYTARRLKQLIESHLLRVSDQRGALFMPPVPLSWSRKLIIPAERLGLWSFPQFSGVHVIEAQKDIVIPNAALRLVRPSSRRYIPVPAANASMVAKHQCKHGFKDGNS